MGLRIKLRKTFSSSSTKKASFPECSPTGEKYYTNRTDIEYYKPNEIPKSKYRGKIDPEHAASLAAFSLADAFSTAKKRSSAALSGTFSPRGTNAQSRAASRMASRVQSRATSRAPSRRPSFDIHRSNLRTETHDSSISSSGSASISASTALDIETASSMLHPSVSTYMVANIYPSSIDIRPDHRRGIRTCRAQHETGSARQRHWHGHPRHYALKANDCPRHAFHRRGARTSHDTRFIKTQNLCRRRICDAHAAACCNCLRRDILYYTV